MADISDIEAALVTLCGTTLYPNGNSNPSITGNNIRIYRGWPNSGQLDTDLAAGVSHVTVAEQAGYSRLTGGYLCDSPINVMNAVTLTAGVAGSTVTLGGVPGTGQAVAVIVDGVGYSYTLTGADTLATAAIALAAVVNAGAVAEVFPTAGGYGSGVGFAGMPGGYCIGRMEYANVNNLAQYQVIGSGTAATPNGSSITFATTRPIVARTGAVGTSQTRPRWQCQGVRITAWTPTPAIRDAICSQLDAILSNTSWLALPDNQKARLEWRNSYSDDVPQRDALWKRDLIYTAQFATTITVPAYPLLVPVVAINGASHAR